MSGTDSPDPVALGGALTVNSLNVNATIRAIFLAGYRLFLLQNGTNTVPATVEGGTVAGSNTAPGTRTQSIATSLTVTIVDPTPSNRASGDESVSPVPTSTTLFSSDLDHFKCYKAKDLRNPRFAPRDGVALDDQFGNDVVEVKQPMMIVSRALRRFCRSG